jgi:hypothetical protein
MRRTPQFDMREEESSEGRGDGNQHQGKAAEGDPLLLGKTYAHAGTFLCTNDPRRAGAD